MIPVWVDPEDDDSRKRMIRSEARRVIEYLEAAKYCALVIRREGIDENQAWGDVALQIDGLIARIRRGEHSYRDME